ncbi:hypothetical protein [Streptomyces sp. NPDC088348]|uniref:hypothetical protein n=1 Tax=Streptomyces sp. NPDC088348 TaxID=3365853 RepID=UPI00380E002F
MNRRALPAVAALSATAALLMTACSSGSGGGGSSSDKIKGVDHGSAASPSASAAREPGGAQRPNIKLPTSFQVEFTGWTNSDPKLQAILDDSKQQLMGSYAAIIAGNPNDAPMAFYNTGEALMTGKQWIKGFADKDLTLIGKTRAYKPQARISPNGSGTFFYCVDESKSSTRNTKTNKVTGTPADKAQVLYRTKLSKNSSGVWQTTFVTTTQGGCR